MTQNISSNVYKRVLYQEIHGRRSALEYSKWSRSKSSNIIKKNFFFDRVPLYLIKPLDDIVDILKEVKKSVILGFSKSGSYLSK
jgi:hypothetical protein